MKKHFVFGIIILLLLNSCSKDVGILQPQTAIPNYTPMTVGSYWIYDWYQVDPYGNSTLQPYKDSIYIAGDTIVGTDTFAIRVGTWCFPNWKFREYWKDSAGYLVNPWGGVGFSATNFTDTLFSYYAGDEKRYRIMMDIGEIVTVPVGTFRTLNAAYVHEKLIGTWGSCWPIYDIHDFQYAENVGMVRTSFQFLGNPPCIVWEGRLRTYYIAP